MNNKWNLFANWKHKQEPSSARADDSQAPVLILGSGCANCHNLETNTRAALESLGSSLPVGHVTDFSDIAKYGVMQTPALVVHGQVLVSGRVPSVQELAQLLRQHV